MFNPLGCLSFGQRQNEAAGAEEEEENEEASPSSSTTSTPRTRSSSRSSDKNGTQFFSRNRTSKKNPYSTSGLDKFSTLLTDLQERRRKIYDQMTSSSSSHSRDDELPYVGFIPSNSGDWEPIVVKSRDNNQNDHNHKHKPKQQKHDDKAVGSSGGGGGQLEDKPQGVTKNPPTGAQTRDSNNYPPSNCSTTTTLINNNNKASTLKPVVQFQQPPPASSASTADVRKVNKKNSHHHHHHSHRRKHGRLERWSRPSQYLPIVLLLSLVWLMMFGRSVAILLTSAWWYLLPTIKMLLAGRGNPIHPKPKKSSKDYSIMLTTQKKIPSMINDFLPTKRRINGQPR